mmetsp:Transcript_15610/g.21579  ORF Transcript_15610/g.21579 Transcript_15610/m.21579 type:complete len:824 (-) Transcript_15610:244-2715(-)|eukprot:CAMPEP_0196598404 /NCGR_PEP_ID=MMETSP1081-20130531/94301_1 /TAXON_ID=36882 /ORGANISM="Pyramimonas amylifera, Strain CCMP720" /LENGTH=823 /DNA_ID=CAMNT_0041924095 /DNA_START=109 /DNA_END=2580 /DNA_ORIENTATION=+
MTDFQEQRLAHKSAFTNFLDQDLGQSSYVNKINKMCEAEEHRLLVDLNDIRLQNQDLARGLMESPAEYLPPFEEALEDLVRNQRPKYLLEGQTVHIGFTGSFGFHRVSPRELLSPLLSKLVCLEGIITKCSLVRPKVSKSVHYCPTTGEFVSREYRDITSNSGLPTGSSYPTRDADGNLLETEYGLSVYHDHQSVTVQEMPENAPPGQIPCSVDLVLEDDLVDLAKPGDRVAIVGVFKACPHQAKGATSGMFRTLIVANTVRQLAKDVQQPSFSQEDMKNIRRLVKRKDLFDIVGDSLAPSIFGHDMIKKALALQLLGGHEKNLPNGTHLRGDVNVLMVGDPSVAKSQMIRAVMNVAPLSISTTGRGSSGVGLTAAVTQDKETGERRLEAGAMVLADRGLVCIDEFDKMNDSDRVAIHEVMEQQTVTIAKAGIQTTLNARCSVLAAANPIYGAYDHSRSITFNIALPDSLLSRFDVVFVVLDQSTTDTDRLISEHVLRMHRYRKPGDTSQNVGTHEFMTALTRPVGEEDEEKVSEDTPMWVKYNRLLHGKTAGKKRRELLSTAFLKKYMHWCKFLKPPQLTDDAVNYIAEQYSEMRQDKSQEGAEKTLPVTARSLETMIRLSTAHAKLRQSKDVTLEDTEAALGVMKYAIYADEKRKMDKQAAADAQAELEQLNKEKVEEAAKENEAAPEGAVAMDVEPRQARSRRGREEIEEDAGAKGPESQPSKRQRQETQEETPETEPLPAAAGPVEITDEYYKSFMRVLLKIASPQGDDAQKVLSITAVKIQVNLLAPGEFPEEAITALLNKMDSEGKIMITGDAFSIL